jgi:transposase
MSKIIFNAFQMKQLEANPNVSKVSERSLTYHPDFKLKATQDNLKGKEPMQIFLENGFNLTIIGKDKPKQCLKRWRKIYEQFGEDGFYTERRGKASTGRPSSKPMTPEVELKKAQARIAFLEAELDFLKKLDELERQALQKKR